MKKDLQLKATASNTGALEQFLGLSGSVMLPFAMLNMAGFLVLTVFNAAGILGTIGALEVVNLAIAIWNLGELIRDKLAVDKLRKELEALLKPDNFDEPAENKKLNQSLEEKNQILEEEEIIRILRARLENANHFGKNLAIILLRIASSGGIVAGCAVATASMFGATIAFLAAAPLCFTIAFSIGIGFGIYGIFREYKQLISGKNVDGIDNGWKSATTKREKAILLTKKLAPSVAKVALMTFSVVTIILKLLIPALVSIAVLSNPVGAALLAATACAAAIAGIIAVVQNRDKIANFFKRLRGGSESHEDNRQKVIDNGKDPEAKEPLLNVRDKLQSAPDKNLTAAPEVVLRADARTVSLSDAELVKAVQGLSIWKKPADEIGEVVLQTSQVTMAQQ
jgi:hypothetical protein